MADRALDTPPGEEQTLETSPEHFDVLIVGAGLSGICAGYHLRSESPQKSYAILEARDAIGGTWDLFRYPGIRSDSDMYTLGYPFRPWRSDVSIAAGASILEYVRETATDSGIDARIRFNHHVNAAEWSSELQRWSIQAQRTDTGQSVTYTCGFLLMCTGYYRYDAGYTPQFAGTERYTGRIVHPQFWTDDIDYADRRVIVIGSGATAVTLVPALAEQAEHVTMLQRSPSYVVSLPAEDPLAKLARRFLSERTAYRLVRWKNVLLAMAHFQLSRRRPELIKKLIRQGIEHNLPPGYDIDTHFKPRYNPWHQRLCLVPDGDLFEVLSDGRASIVTDEIETFIENGIRLASGGELEADLIVTATGLNMLVFGGIDITVDGRTVEPPDTVIYKGMMLSGVPNAAYVFGYTNASWTLKCDLTCEYIARLLNHMDAQGYTQCAPRSDPSLATEPMIDFSSGYIQRSISQFPKQGPRDPWRLHQNYVRDLLALRRSPIEDGALEFSRGRTTADPADREALAAAA